MFSFFLIIRQEVPSIYGKDNYLKDCQTNSFTISKCNRSKYLNYQEKYDMFYNNYDKFYDDGFVVGFLFAYAGCQEHKSQCSLRENSHEFSDYRIQKNEKLCIENYYFGCVANEINPRILNPESYISKYTKPEKIKLFESVILKHYKIYDEVCISFTDFYHTLSIEEKSTLNQTVLKQCEKFKNVGIG